MSSIEKAKAWIKENAPMLAVFYENKYVGMAYDHFASLDSRKQKQVIVGGFLSCIGVIVLMLLGMYMDLWSAGSSTRESREMITLLQRYQKERTAQSGEIDSLERNARLAANGEFKRYLTDQAKMAGISGRSVEVQEQDGPSANSGGQGASNVRSKQATVTLQRINLAQLKNFLSSIEMGTFTLGVSSIRITNDDKIRGYMKVDVGVIAYLFQGEENS